MLKIRVMIRPESILFHGRVILRCCGIPKETAQALIDSPSKVFEFEVATMEKAEAAILDLCDEGFQAELVS